MEVGHPTQKVYVQLTEKNFDHHRIKQMIHTVMEQQLECHVAQEFGILELQHQTFDEVASFTKIYIWFHPSNLVT